MAPTLQLCKRLNTLSVLLISFKFILTFRRVILSVIAFLVVAATVHEYVRTLISRPIDSKKDGLAVRVLHCFSFSNNRRKLMATAPSAENIGCINGIRVMSTLWVVLGHSFLNFSQMGPNSFVAQKVSTTHPPSVFSSNIFHLFCFYRTPRSGVSKSLEMLL